MFDYLFLIHDVYQHGKSAFLLYGTKNIKGNIEIPSLSEERREIFCVELSCINTALS